MPRKYIENSDYYPYHIYNRTNNKQFFELPMHSVWEIFCKYATFMDYLFGVKIHAFVLMSNHYHMILSTPHCNIGEAVQYFQRETSKEINKINATTNHIFGGRYFKSLIKDPAHYSIVLKYVYRNPVKAGIVSNIENYSYSSLNNLLGRSNLMVRIHEHPQDFSAFIGHESEDSYLDWLNVPFNIEIESGIIKGLNKSEFKLPAKKSRYNHSIDDEIYRP